MGILDDAIREHLELKRAHGASEAEIRHKEVEVFGQTGHAPETAVADETALMDPAAGEPVQAAEHPAPAPEDPYVVHPGDHAVPDPHHEGEPGGSDPAWGEDTEFFSEPPAQAQHEPAPDHHADERHPALHDTDEHFRGHEHPPEPVFQHQAPPAVEEPEPEEPVEEPPVEEPPVEGDEDVLEETPEFLQDAPEHDRLWFEQKPPRDFDFGE